MLSFRNWLSSKKEKDSFSDQSTEEKDFIRKYKGKSGVPNRVLSAKHHFNEPEPAKIGDFDVKRMDKFTNRKLGDKISSNLGKDPSVYSGLDYNPLKHSKDGHMYVPSYMSTSVEKKPAKDFAVDLKDDPHRHMLHLHLNKDNKGIYHQDDEESENEFTLPRKSKIHIFKSELDKDDPTLMIHHATVTHDHNPGEEERNETHLRMSSGPYKQNVMKHLSPENATKYDKSVSGNFSDVFGRYIPPEPK